MTYSRDIIEIDDQPNYEASPTAPAVPVLDVAITKGSNKRTVATWKLLSKLQAAEQDPVAAKLVADLDKAIDALKSADTAINTQLTTLKSNYTALDTSKANKTDLDALKAKLKELEDKLAATPSQGATPQQIADLNSKIAQVEALISTVGGGKGTLQLNARTHFWKGGVLYGGARRLVQADINDVNYNTPNPPTAIYDALNGTGSTNFYNITNQYLTWFFARSLPVWRIELIVDNASIGNRDLLRDGSKIIDISNAVGTYTHVWTPSASTGWVNTSKLQFKDDGARGYLNTLYVSISDPSNPAVAPTLTNNYQLALGDRFRFEGDGLSTLMEYQGTDAASGLWKAKPVATLNAFDSALSAGSINAVQNAVLTPIIQALQTAVNGLETAMAGLSGNTAIQRDNGPPSDGDWDFWIQTVPGPTTTIVRGYVRLLKDWAGLLFEKELAVGLSEAIAVYDPVTQLYSVGVNGLNLQYSKVPVTQYGQQSFANSYVLALPDANSQFTNIAYELINSSGTVIGNGGFVPTTGSNLTVIAPVSGTAKIKYTLTPITGQNIVYEVVL